MSAEGKFGRGADAWLSGLGLVRDAVRQELVHRQLVAHLPPVEGPLRVLDAGCGLLPASLDEHVGGWSGGGS